MWVSMISLIHSWNDEGHGPKPIKENKTIYYYLAWDDKATVPKVWLRIKVLFVWMNIKQIYLCGMRFQGTHMISNNLN